MNGRSDVVRRFTVQVATAAICSVLLVVGVPLLSTTVPWLPASAQPTSRACPTDRVPATRFTDTVRSSHRASIDCAAWWGVVTGRTPSSFAPAAAITRGQTAAMVARLLRDAGTEHVAAPSALFSDIDGHTFEDDIDLLAASGIVTGVTPTRFAPDQRIDRGQMASIIARMFERGLDAPLPAARPTFQDVSAGNVHRGAIGSLVAADIAAGTSETHYAPDAPVRRGQMASFLVRATSRLVGGDRLTLPLATPATDDPYTTRTRGAWVHLFDPSLKDRAGVDRLVEELASADANTIIAQVARRHDAYYHSEVLPRTPDTQVAPDFDVLAELLAAANERGMEVHAWISVAPTTHEFYDDLPAPAGWVASEHGQDAPVDQRWVTRSDAGEWSNYLDPGVPAVQDHVAAIAGELAERYPVDGVHLDYVRYASDRYGYHPVAIDRFRAETGRSDIPPPADPQWRQWRRDQATEIIRRAGAAIDATGNDVDLSAAVISRSEAPRTPDRAGFRGTLPYTQHLQDWDQWVRAGLVDAVYPMNYFRAHDPTAAAQFAGWVDYERALGHEANARVVPGPAGYLNHPEAAYAQAQTALRQGEGAMLYSYQQPTIDQSRAILRRLGVTRWGYQPRS